MEGRRQGKAFVSQRLFSLIILLRRVGSSIKSIFVSASSRHRSVFLLSGRNSSEGSHCGFRRRDFPESPLHNPIAKIQVVTPVLSNAVVFVHEQLSLVL